MHYEQTTLIQDIREVYPAMHKMENHQQLNLFSGLPVIIKESAMPL
jgi:hypothetical protein